jgi:predicted HicB family RNase H-like nuclease
MKSTLSLNDYLKMPWHYCTEPTEWEGESGFWVSVAELPSCSTFARSLEEGLSTIAKLLKEYLQVAIDSQAEVSLPKPNSFDENIGGKLLLRIPKSLHIGIKNAAKQENVSINKFAVYALTQAVTQSTKPKFDTQHIISEHLAKYYVEKDNSKQKRSRKK